MSNYLLAFKRWKDFQGRSTRKEYWMFALTSMFIAITLQIISVSSISIGLLQESDILFGLGGIFSAVLTIYGVIVLVPSLAVTVRRLHDIGSSGSKIFIALIPVVGPIWLLVLLTKESAETTIVE